GFAVAAAAARRGADTVLVAGPVALPTPAGVERIDVRSAAQMHAAVVAALPGDVFVAAAAVADFRPSAIAAHKIKKRPGEDGLELRLVRTRDIVADVAAHARRPRLVVAFAAETSDLAAHALGKLRDKRVDLVAANHVGRAGIGFESEDNALTLYWHHGEEALPRAPKTQLAERLLDRVRALLP
ncbi:MAG TPA: phosphopantothenoylcysteine decarboxylase, partial [Luteimonas sp.]|nr:phosphopantothenoylcysteine decarboxylase [Luteimonas sp.]